MKDRHMKITPGYHWPPANQPCGQLFDHTSNKNSSRVCLFAGMTPAILPTPSGLIFSSMDCAMFSVSRDFHCHVTYDRQSPLQLNDNDELACA
jgi:hypothetical protein